MEIRNLLEPVIDALGYELVLAELVGGGRRTLRLYIDAPGGVTVDDCEAVSLKVGAELDVANPVAGRYTLEVSSPGWERPLVKAEHFQRFVGERVRLRLLGRRLGRRGVTGVLTGADDDGIVVVVDGEAFELVYDDIENARLAPAPAVAKPPRVHAVRG